MGGIWGDIWGPVGGRSPLYPPLIPPHSVPPPQLNLSLYGVSPYLPMRSLWGLYGVSPHLPMGSLWGLYGVSLYLPMVSLCVRMGSLWGPYGVSMGSLHISLWGPYGVPMGSLRSLYGISMSLYGALSPPHPNDSLWRRSAAVPLPSARGRSQCTVRLSAAVPLPSALLQRTLYRPASARVALATNSAAPRSRTRAPSAGGDTAWSAAGRGGDLWGVWGSMGRYGAVWGGMG